MIDILLPIPPSANAIWRGIGAHVVKSAGYKAWINEAGFDVQIAKCSGLFGGIKPVIGSYMLLLALPRSMRGDIDNRHKAVNDLFQRMGIVPDDKHCNCLLVVYADDLAKDKCRVVIGKIAEIMDFQEPHPLIHAAVYGFATVATGETR